jgi:alpha-2-macroglobulin
MFAVVRVAMLGASLALAATGAGAAGKPFQRDDLTDSGIKLEAQIKHEAGVVLKPIGILKHDADVAFERRDFRTGMQILGQIAALVPNDAGNWLRLARAILKIQATEDAERTLLLERAATAAYIAYQRTNETVEAADSLVLLGRTFVDRKLWRPALDALRLSLELREVADVRALYEQTRSEHGFRILDYTVDSDAASPRVCFQFSEPLASKRVDFSPFVAVAGQDKPALSSDDKQLCVDGLTHGEGYTVTLRAGLPSAVSETLSKSADFTIYVRDRAPLVHFSGNAYVLPRAGQRGIPIISVNTSEVDVEIHRVGDRNLIDTMQGSDFKRSLYRYDVQRLADERGAPVWRGVLQVNASLNADVTTTFPLDQTLGILAPGVYVMVAEPSGQKSDQALATQWFIVSDLGLSALSGHDGIMVFVHSLATTEARSGAVVRLIARNNEVLATRNTDSGGVARFEPGLARGEGGQSPAMLIVEEQGDYAFLNLRAPAFDLSDRGVVGRTVRAGLDAFVFAERGVYRSGETVNVTALLRDARGQAISGAPLTLVVDRPDGVEFRRAHLPDQGIGGRALSVALPSGAPTGTWRVRAFSDPKAQSIGETTFMVEDYVPDRLEFDLKTQATAISLSESADIAVDARYLYGAPGSGLTLEGDVGIAAVRQRGETPGYQFGLSDDEVTTVRRTLENLPDTSDRGSAHFAVSLNQVPATTQPLQADITVRVSEPGGRAVERKLTLPVTPSSTMIGVKPLFNSGTLSQDDRAGFDVIVLAPDGRLLNRRGLHWQLLKVERHYQWYRQGGDWEYEPVPSTRRVADGTLDVAVDKPGHVDVPVTWGRYRLEVSSEEPAGPITSVSFDAGWYADAAPDRPDLLEVALDKSEYGAGDTMEVAVTARTAGKLTIAVVGEGVKTTAVTDVQPGLARVPIVIAKDWGPGAYIVATLRRPLDTQTNRLPGRAIGVRWFSVARAAHTLAVNLKLPDLTRPNETLHVPLQIAGLVSGEEARVVVAAVDLGILNLTAYRPPAPEEYYLGQRQLATEIRDLYGQLIDGMQGIPGKVRTGGDAGSAELTGSPPTQPPLALYSGLVTVGPDGTADVSFPLPAFSGTLRVMAVAWSNDKLGHATGDVIVRDPVVLTATLPRFLLGGDHGSMQLDVDNVEGVPGDYQLQVTTDGPLGLSDPSPHTLNLAAKQRGTIRLALDAAGVGNGTVAVHVSGPSGFSLARQYGLAIKPATQVLTRRTVKSISPGESLTLSNDLFADLVPGTGTVALSVGPSSALDVATLLQALDRYPYGCSEQITSQALALLYVNELAADAHPLRDTSVDQRVRDAIDRLLTRQGANGSFGLWSAGGDDAWLDAYVTDFLTRARERGFVVADTAFRLALDRLRNFVATAPEPAKAGEDLAYALYVLSRNRLAPLGDLRYIADAKLGDLKTSMARAQIAAALGMLGDRIRAERAYAAAIETAAALAKPSESRTDYGSQLRDAAALVTLASEGGASRPTVLDGVARVEAARERRGATSTQEDAWLVLAARVIDQERRAMTLDVAGSSHAGPLYRTFDASDLGAGAKIANRSDAPFKAVVSVSGAPVTPEPATESGFKIERRYFTLGGEPADATKARQNQRFVVILRITEPRPQFGRVMVSDYLPAGFEIDNPHLVSSADAGSLPWIEDAVEPVSSEFRDDRFMAAFDRRADDRAVFTVAYAVRAVSPGRYVLPQASVEDMYRPDRFGHTATGTVDVAAAP